MTPVDQVVAWVLEGAELPKQKAPLRVTVHQGKPSYTISGEPVFSWYVEIWRQVTRGKSKGEWAHVFNSSGSAGDRGVAIRAARRVSETLGLGGKFFWRDPHADEREPGLGRGFENPRKKKKTGLRRISMKAISPNVDMKRVVAVVKVITKQHGETITAREIRQGAVRMASALNLETTDAMIDMLLYRIDLPGKPSDQPIPDWKEMIAGLNPADIGDAFDALYHEVYAILRSDDLKARRPLLEALWPEYVYAERPDQDNDYFVNIWGEYHWPERYGKARLPLIDLSLRLRRAVVAGVL